jgi:hypothetical protein
MKNEEYGIRVRKNKKQTPPPNMSSARRTLYPIPIREKGDKGKKFHERRRGFF